MNKEILGRLKKISERLKKNYNAEKVILFGSYARGEETEDSDVDLLVISPRKERKNIGDQFIMDIFENGISL